MLFIVDSEFRLIARTAGGTGSTDTSDAAWARIEPLARSIAAGDASDDTHVLPESAGEVVRVSALRGEMAGYAVVLERRRSPRAIRTTCVTFGLSQRECDVLELIVAGMSTAEIGRRLNIADATVQSHVRNVGIKMGCSKRSAMIARALLG